MTLRSMQMQSPIGTLFLVASEEALVSVGFSPVPHPAGTNAVLAEARRELNEYFAGHRRRFELSLAPAGSAFERSVWKALGEIPCGETRSYSAIAARIGRPRAARAVGAANGNNPLAIVVPCHRVIGANGTLTGYAGGLERKRWLLAHEGPAEASAFEV